MDQRRLSRLILFSLFVVILSFINTSQCLPDKNHMKPNDIYRYEHQKLPVNGKTPIISEIHFLHRKERVRRDASEDSKSDNPEKEKPKLQDANEVSKASTSSDTAQSGASDITSPGLTGSATSHKTQIVETKPIDQQKMNKTAQLFDTDLAWDNVDRPDTVINGTFKAHNKSIGQNEVEEGLNDNNDNEHSTTEDHKYYLAEKVVIGKEHPYIDLDDLKEKFPDTVKEHPMLSRSYRRAATIPLTFSFPFYGHEVKNITIATGGFLYTGDYVHSWLAATQYIAPLMANFDTSSSPNSKIRYADNGTSLIVEWLNVKIQSRSGGTNPASNGNSDKNSYNVGEDTYQFQVVLHKSGDIVFAYKTIPTAIELLKDNEHPVKVGLSDAYIIDRTIFFVRRKTIYEYHRINKMKTDIKSGVAIVFRAQKTCNVQKNCNDCVKQNKCNWCQKLGRCSDGMDRLRQEWLMAHCDENNAQTQQQCKAIAENPQIHNIYKKPGNNRHDLDHPGYSEEHEYGVDSTNEVGKERLSAKGNYEQATITTISIVALIALSIMVWFVYAYFFPHSWSGQLLIKYRPSRWQWRRGEPRYTAASIHM